MYKIKNLSFNIDFLLEAGIECLSSLAGLHELDALQDQEVKDFRSKMQRISEEKMQSVHMMSWAEWLQSCFSPQLEVGPVDALCDRNEGFIKITMHYNQSQVHQ